MDNGSIWNSEEFVLCDKKNITSVVQNNESSAHVPLAWYKSGNIFNQNMLLSHVI